MGGCWENKYWDFTRTEMTKENIFCELREKGGRITKQRKILLDIILEGQCTCCKDIYYKAIKRDPTIGIATVYRMISSLEDIGAICRNKMYEIQYQEEISEEKGGFNIQLGQSMEDYLKAIFLLQKQQMEVCNIQIAEMMGCSKPGVTVAINALIEKGYVERKTHGNFCLTPKGTKLVNKIRNRSLFFQKILLEAGIERKQAEKEACMLEHSNGNLAMIGGTYALSSGDDGIHADSNVTISGGNIDIAKSYEGIEGLSVDVTGGEISVLASDDGMNAAGGNDSSGFDGAGAGGDEFASTEGAYIHISGGVLHVNASGDGIDSNGDITVSGGETYVLGPTNDGNGTLDYSGTAQITGGIFAASGSSGMAQNFDSSFTQGVIMLNVEEQEGNTEIALLDISGTELLSWTAEKAYSSIIVSSPDMKEGETYTLKAGTTEESITMDSLVYGNGSPAGGMPGNNGEERGGMKEGGMKEGGMQGEPGKGGRRQ